MFLSVFYASNMFLPPPPWKILPSPGKKSADAHGPSNVFIIIFLLQNIKSVLVSFEWHFQSFLLTKINDCYLVNAQFSEF